MFDVYDIYLENELEIAEEGIIKNVSSAIMAVINKILDFIKRILIRLRRRNEPYVLPSFVSQYYEESLSFARKAMHLKSQLIKGIPIKSDGSFDHDALEQKFPHLTRRPGQPVKDWLHQGYAEYANGQPFTTVTYKCKDLIKSFEDYQVYLRSYGRVDDPVKLMQSIYDDKVKFELAALQEVACQAEVMQMILDSPTIDIMNASYL